MEIAKDRQIRLEDGSCLSGYLATVSDDLEASFIEEFFCPRDIGYWIAATDEKTEGTWRWFDGPDKGQVFWTIGPDGEGRAVNGYSVDFWQEGEPTNSDDVRDENFVALGLKREVPSKTAANDVSSINHRFVSLVEYGGLSCDGQLVGPIGQVDRITFNLERAGQSFGPFTRVKMPNESGKVSLRESCGPD
jgi:hypothetical protein